MFAGRLCTLVPKPRRDAILGASHADLFSASKMRQMAGVAFSMHTVLAGVLVDGEELVEATGQPAVGAMVSRGNSSLTTTTSLSLASQDYCHFRLAFLRSPIAHHMHQACKADISI